jgi:predicted permease
MPFPRIGLAARSLARRPALAAAVLLTLGIGIGASSTIFSFVDGVLLRPLPLPAPDRVLSVYELHGATRLRRMTYATFRDLARYRFQHLAAVAASRSWNFALESEGEPEQVAGGMVSEDFFAVTGTAPLAGRYFGRDESQAGRTAVIVLSHALWSRRFGGSPDAIGKTVRIGETSSEIVGVAPAALDPPAGDEIWVPLDLSGPLGENRRSHLLEVVGRLRPGSSVAQARSELAAFAGGLPRGDDDALSIDAVLLQEILVAPVRPMLLLLFGAVALLLALVTLNVMNLLLARAMSREREMAIRSALGATPADITLSFLGEGLVLGLCGTALGVVAAMWGISAVKALLPETFPRLAEVTLSRATVLAGFSGGLLASTAAALVPALRRLRRGSIGLIGRDTGRVPGRHLAREVLAAGQVALAMVLLVGAGLSVRSFLKLQQVDPGYRRDGVIGFDLPLAGRQGDDPARQAPLLMQMLERLRGVPGVESAGLVNGLPLTGGPTTGVAIEDRPGMDVSAAIRIADARYFETLGIPLREGRTFQAADGPGAPLVVVVSAAFARAAWPGQDALGRRVTMKDWGDPLGAAVVGVVGDVRLSGLANPVEPTMYWHFLQFPSSFNTAVVRTALAPQTLLAAARREVWSVDPGQPIGRVRSLESLRADSMARDRLSTVLLVAFGAAALLLAGIALYSVLSNLVAERTREIAIRGALGASRGTAMRRVLTHAGVLTSVGVAVGGALSLAAAEAIAQLLYDVQPRDPLTFAAVALIVAASAAMAAWLPAQRAASVDPMAVLRDE